MYFLDPTHGAITATLRKVSLVMQYITFKIEA